MAMKFEVDTRYRT